MLRLYIPGYIHIHAYIQVSNIHKALLSKMPSQRCSGSASGCVVHAFILARGCGVGGAYMLHLHLDVCVGGVDLGELKWVSDRWVGCWPVGACWVRIRWWRLWR